MSTPEDLVTTADLIRSEGRRVITAEVDVRDYDGLKAAVDGAVAELGRLDIIVANAGIGNEGGALIDLQENLWDDMIDVNLGGVWKSVKAAVPHMIAGERGGSVLW